MKKVCRTLLMLVATLPAMAQESCFFCNTNFDSTNIAGNTLALVDASLVPCWKTTSTDNKIEIWSNGYNGVSSYSGIQHCEINGSQSNSIYQDLTMPAGSTLKIQFAHRGRGGTDTVGVEIGPSAGPFTIVQKYGTSQSAWSYYTLNYAVPFSYGGNIAVRFKSVYWGFGNPAVGNFLDAVSICPLNSTELGEIGTADDVLLYPNPMIGHTTLHFNTELSQAEMKMYNLQGTLVMEKKSISGQTLEIDRAQLPSGVYLLTVTEKSKLLVRTKLLVID